MIDFVAIGLRALAFAAVLQAAGVPLFLWLFAAHLDRAAKPIGTLAVHSAIAGVVLTLGQAAVEPARLAGEFRGILDPALHGILLSSAAGTTVAIRLLGLAMIAAGCIRYSRFGAAAALIGSTLIVASFAFMGHTASDDNRWLLAVLLIIHLLIIAFWFGALWPLLLATRCETAAKIGAIIEQFSQLAIWLVPMLFIAGLALAITLLPSSASLLTPYGMLLLSKITAFGILLGLASLNKWRFARRIGGGDTAALRALQRSVTTEWLLIVGVVSVTAVMTGLFAPGH